MKTPIDLRRPTLARSLARRKDACPAGRRNALPSLFSFLSYFLLPPGPPGPPAPAPSLSFVFSLLIHIRIVDADVELEMSRCDM